MSLRLSAKQFFLTYPQCPLDKERVLEQLSLTLNIEQYVIAQETHEDGNLHIHAYIKCVAKVNLKSATTLDIDGYHGNYQTCRNPNAVKTYCTKANDYITNIASFKPIAAAIRVINADSTEEAMAIIKSDPVLARDYIRDTARMEESIARLNIKQTFIDLRYRFITLQGIANWRRTKKALWLRGPTNTGKTEFAKAQFMNPLFVSHIDDLKKLKPTHDGIVFDDMSFKHLPREHQIHIVDLANDRSINVKYGSVTIPRLTPRIFTSNVAIFTEDPAITRRIRFIRIQEDLRLLDTDVDSDNSSGSYAPDVAAYY